MRQSGDCQHHGGREPGLGDKANLGEPLQTSSKQEAKGAANWNMPLLKREVVWWRGYNLPARRQKHHRRKDGAYLTPSFLRNVVSPLVSWKNQESQPQGGPMGQRVQDAGKSEGRSVMERIG